MGSNIFDLSNRIALITGGGKGLGRAMALGLADAGASVVIVGRTRAALEKTSHEIIKKGGSADFRQMDISDNQAVQELVVETVRMHGRIDILINNVGVAPVKPALSITREEWDHVFNMNLGSLFNLTRSVAEHMVEAKSGNIINIASVLGKMAGHFVAHYSASKAAIIQATKSLALEWAPFNVRVNCIAPGFFETDMTRIQQEDERQHSFLKRKIPFGRMGTPEEIIGAAVFLASQASAYVTGTTLFVDGGYSIW